MGFYTGAKVQLPTIVEVYYLSFETNSFLVKDFHSLFIRVTILYSATVCVNTNNSKSPYWTLEKPTVLFLPPKIF